MIDRLADSPPTSTALATKDFLVLGAPVATVLAAVIAGAIVIRNARKTPFDRLDMLMKIRAAWPTELAGRGAMDRAILRAAADVRVVEGDIRSPLETVEERDAFTNALSRARTRLVGIATAISVWSIFICAAYTPAFWHSGVVAVAAVWVVAALAELACALAGLGEPERQPACPKILSPKRPP